jgi:hypothetical protein
VCRAGDHAERLRQAASGFVGRGVERRQQLREILVQSLAPRERRRHVVHAARDRSEFVGLVLGHALAEVPRGHPLERGDHAAERRRQAAAVVPEAEAEDRQHRHEQHRRRHGRLHRAVAGVGSQLLQLRHLGRDGRRGTEPLHPLQALSQVDHGLLCGAGALPRGDLRDEADEGHGDEGRREQAGDAGGAGGAHGAP